VLREKAGVAELFFPVYFGLILLWPEAWSGDRFALPLLPLVFFYAGAALQWLLGPFQVGARRAVIGALVVAVAIPAALQTRRMAEGAGACRELTRMGRPSECLSPAMGEYLALAEWSGENLPDGAVVTTRKPRFFFLMSGVKAKAIPMVLDSDEFLARLREGGSRYVSLDFLDGMSGYYVYPAILDRLTSFCGMVEVGPPEEAGTQLLGIPDSSPGMAGEGTAEQTLARCPEEMFRVPPREGNPVRYWGIPLLTRGSPPGE
jgi:hypothetical protein